MTKHKCALLLVSLLAGLLAIATWTNAAPSPQSLNIPGVLSYQGVLSDSQGQPVTGSVKIGFRLYTLPLSGAASWAETQTVTVNDGLFSVYLGDITDLNETLFDGQDLYLGVTVGTDSEMSPRLRLASVPYAFGAGQVLCTRLTWYYDGDGDGYGDPVTLYQSCEAPPNYVANGDDCNDDDATLSPETPWYADGDEDGYGDPAVSQLACEAPSGYVADSSDCDDGNPAVHTDATWYADADEDTFGNPAVAQVSCGQPEGYVSNNLDCNDLDADVNPDATEICDGLDNDCDAQTDEIEDLTPPTCMMQEGVCATAVASCGGSSGWLTCTALDYGPDYESEETRCDGLDNDCDAQVDEGCP